MKTTNIRPHTRLACIGAILGAFFAMAVLSTQAQDTNTLEVIRQLQKRIEELEHKVQVLEQEKQPTVAATNPSAPDHRIEALDQKVKTLEQARRVDEAAAEAKAKEAPRISVGEQGFSLRSANGDFAVQFKGVLQVDSRTFFGNGGIVGNDSFLLRRARPILQGTVFRDFDYLFVPDFGGTGAPQIYDAYVNYRFLEELQLQAGKFKTPVGLEQLQADKDILFNERSLVTDLVPNRDIGFQVHGSLFGGPVSYGAGVFNGVADAQNSNNGAVQNDKAFAGRLFFEPFRRSTSSPFQGLGVGAAGSYQGMQTTNTSGLPSGYATVGQETFFNYNPTSKAVTVASGEHWRFSPQGYWYYGPFSLLGEYVMSDQEVHRTVTAPARSALLNNTAWEVTAGWVLTGEQALYEGGITPRRPFNPWAGQWGAWQLVGRYSELDIDPATFPLYADPSSSAREAREWSVGLNWYLNRNVRMDTSFSHTTFDGGGTGTTGPGSVTRHDESVLFTRMQLAF